MEENIKDSELLGHYAEGRSQEAFAELVRRHLGLVYSAALRRLGGDAHGAADVAQQVFTTLARDAAKLSRHPALAAWLYTATRHAALDAIRTERRRSAREQEAHLMQESNAPAAEAANLRPVLDAAMDELPEADRTAVLLRFFEQRSFAEIGAALKLREDAARMRTERALDKLGALLARRGITSTSGALAAALAHQIAVAAPAGMAAAISGAALAGSAGGSVGAGILTFMSINKTSAGVLAAIAGVLALNLAEQRANAGLRDEFRALLAENPKFGVLRVENQRLAVEATALVSTSPETAELAQLRARAEDLRKQYLANRPYFSVGGRPITHNTPPEEKLEIMYPDGRSSPMRAWQTMLSTGRGRYGLSRDEALDIHALMFCLDERASAKVNAFIAALPYEARSAFPSPERLVASVFDQWLWKGDPPRGYSGTKRSDAFVDDDPTRAVTYWQVNYTSGQKQEVGFPFKRFGDGWRYGPLTAADAEQMLALLDPTTGQPKAPPDRSVQPNSSR